MDGRYGLKELLGSGGTAEVYLAYDVVLDRAVALKMMHGRYAADPSAGQELRREVVERFRREARAAGGLSHPSIVAVYDQGACEDGTLYIAMEYVPGGTLKDGIRRYGAIPPRAAAETALQIANALAAAHDQGMVHRDIKPHNILITASGDVKVTDFGIARAAAVPPESGAEPGEATPGRREASTDARGNPGSDLTATGIVMGTAGYISPEQALGEPAGPQSDLYSLGVTLYEMLTGELPFRAETPLATAVKHVAEPPRPPREVNPAVPPGIDLITRRLLEKDPRRRYADAGALAADLQRILDEPALPETASATAPRTDGARYPLARRRRSGRRRGGWLLVASLVPVLGAALAAYAWAYTPAGVEGDRGPFGGIGEVLEGVPGPVGGTKARAEPGAKPGSETPKSGPPAELEVPDLVGMPLEKAREDGSPAEGLEVVEEDRIASKEPAGVIVEQRPAPAEDPGSEISVVVSEKRLAQFPDVVGGSRDAAARALEAAGFEARFREGESETEEEGRVVGQSPGADARASAGSPVTATIGTGPAEVETPDVRGATVEAARAELEEAGLLLGGTERRPSAEAGAGDVYSQDPAAGVAAEPGAAVDVSVSTGPAEVAVPDVVGLDLDSAKQAVLDAGLGYTSEAVGTPGGFGEREWSVLSTDPPAGTALEPEAYVEIVYVADPAEATTSASPSSSASPPATAPASSPAPTPASPPETRPSQTPEGSGGSSGTPPITSDGGGRGLDRPDERQGTKDRGPKRAGSDKRR